jgi:hypothetical protein
MSVSFLIPYYKKMLLEEFEDTKVVIRIRISKDRQYNGQKNKKLSTRHTHKTKDRVARTLLKTDGELRCSGQLSSFSSTSGTRRDIIFSKLTATVGRLWN